MPPGGGYPAPAGAPAQPPAGAAPGGAAPKKKGGLTGVIIGVVVLLVVAGAAAGLYFAFRGPGSVLSASVPRDTQVFVEVPSIPAALEGMVSMKMVDAEQVDTEKFQTGLIEGLEESFELSEDDAKALLGSIESSSVAVRNVPDEPEFVMLISFSTADGMNKLLEHERFEEGDDVGGGKRYALEKVDADFDEMKDWSTYHRAFATASFDDDGDEGFVWFADQKLLAVGTIEMIEDVSAVVVDGEESLAKTEEWGQAEFPSDSALLVYVDAELLDNVDDDDGEKLVEDYLDGVRPFTGAMRFTDAGLVTSIHGEMKGKRVTDDNELAKAFATPADLTLNHKLPKETLGYMVTSTKSEVSGEELRKLLFAELEEVDEDGAEEAEEGLEKVEDELDLKFEEILDALGDQMVIAVAMEGDEFDPKKKPEEWIEEGAVAVVFSVGDKEKAESILDTFKEKVFEDGPMAKAYELDDKDGGFDAEPESKAAKKGAPSVRARLTDDVLLITAGGIADRFVEALIDGEDTLADDPAHESAVGSFHAKPSMIMWVDAGRIGHALLEFAKSEGDIEEEMEKVEEETGIHVDALVLEGDNRLTSAFAMAVKIGGDTWSWDVEALNLPAMGLAGAVGWLIPSRAAPPMEVYIPDTGIAMCDAYFMARHRCAANNEDEAEKAKVKAEADKLKADFEANPGKKAAIQSQCLKDNSDFTQKNKDCLQIQ